MCNAWTPATRTDQPCWAPAQAAEECCGIPHRMPAQSASGGEECPRHLLQKYVTGASGLLLPMTLEARRVQ